MELYSDQELLYMIRQNTPYSYEELYCKYEKMLMKLSRSLQFGGSCYLDEAIDVSRLSFQQAVECYRENMGSSFSTFLYRVVTSNLSNYRRQIYREVQGHYSYDSIEELEANVLYKKFCQDEQVKTKVEECQQMLNLVYTAIGLEERRVLELLKLGYKQKEIATKLGVSRYRIQYVIRKLKVKYHEIRENKAID